MISADAIAAIDREVEAAAHEIVTFLRAIVKIPSYDSQIGEVGEAVAEKMRSLDFDEVRFDDMGNVIGRVGDGSTIIVLDSHIDTVGIGDRSQWEWDPLEGKVEDGVLYAGAGDEKGSTPPMVYAMAILKNLKLLDGLTLYYFGNMEEWCDGIACHAFVEHEGIKPDFVVIGEPTKMAIYRGHRGRVEVTATFPGKSCHAAMPQLGDNPLYKAARFLEGIETLGETFADDPFLGKGTVAATDMTVDTPSVNAVPDEAQVYIDRRVTVGETAELVLDQLRRCLRPSTQKSRFRYGMNPATQGSFFRSRKYSPPGLWMSHTSLSRRVSPPSKLFSDPSLESESGIFRRMGSIGRAKRAFPRLALGREMRYTPTPLSIRFHFRK